MPKGTIGQRKNKKPLVPKLQGERLGKKEQHLICLQSSRWIENSPPVAIFPDSSSHMNHEKEKRNKDDQNHRIKIQHYFPPLGIVGKEPLPPDIEPLRLFNFYHVLAL